MPLRPEVERSWVDMLHITTAVARRFCTEHAGVESAALAGAWARGITSRADVDLLLIVRRQHQVAPMSRQVADLRRSLPLDATVFLHSRRDMTSMAFRRADMRPLVSLARGGIEVLKRHPRLKSLLKRSLGARCHTLQRFEIVPQTIQTLVPLHDPKGSLTQLQFEQRERLIGHMDACERLLYSQRGFYHLVEAFLQGRVARRPTVAALRGWDVSADKYLSRAFEQFDPADHAKLQILYDAYRATEPGAGAEEGVLVS